MQQPRINILPDRRELIIISENGDQARACLIAEDGHSLQTFLINDSEYHFDFSTLPPGQYSIRIDAGRTVTVKRFSVG